MPLLSDAEPEPVFQPISQTPPSPGGATTDPVDPVVQLSSTGGADPITQVPPSPPEILDPVDSSADTGVITDPSLQDLYPEMPDAVTPDTPTVAIPTGADVTLADSSVAEVGTPGVAGDVTVANPDAAGVTTNDPSVAEVGTPGTAQANTGVLSNAASTTAAQSNLTAEQQVDAELARILGQDSPLLAQAQAEAAQQSNSRGLLNSSMAAGDAYGALVSAAMPMAQQNASQAYQRELANAGFRQEAGIFNASEQNRFAALEAQLGTDVSMFNADQLNQAERLSAQMRTALEQQDTAAFNTAALQFAELQRDAQAQQAQIAFDTGIFNAEQLNQAEQLSAQMRTAIEQGNAAAANTASLQLADLLRSAEQQQADIDFAAEQQGADAQNRLNEQMMADVTALNEQFLRGSQAMDLATIQGTYQQLISTNTTAGNLYGAYFDTIAAVMANPDMTPQQIASAVETAQLMLEASLQMIAEMNDMDFGDLDVEGASNVDVLPPGFDLGGGLLP